MSERSEHLIIQTAFLGDLLLGIPLFKEIRRARPDAKLTLFCRKGLGGLMRELGVVDGVIEADKTSSQSWRAATQEAKSRAYDWLICPHESVRSLRLAFGLKARRKIGYRHPLASLVFHETVTRPKDLPEALRQLALLSPIDGLWSERLDQFRSLQTAPGGQSGGGALLEVPVWADMRVARLTELRCDFFAGKSGRYSPKSEGLMRELGLYGKDVAFIAPGSVWKTKMWLADGFTRVAREFLAQGYRVVITGSPEEKGICEDIAFRAPGAVSVAGRSSLFESAELLTTARILVCNDSGAMHLAAAAGTPTVSVFGPTILDFGYRPWQDSASVVQTAKGELACRPCGSHGSAACPIGTHDCMKRISADRVMQAAVTIANDDERNRNDHETS